MIKGARDAVPIRIRSPILRRTLQCPLFELDLRRAPLDTCISAGYERLYSLALCPRHHGGEFVLGSEDTDRERSTQTSVDAILEGMQWMGLDADEEGPIYQSDRLARYREVLDQLLDQGLAYYCYCTPEELDAVREQQRAQNIKPRYNRKCRDAGILPAWHRSCYSIQKSSGRISHFRRPGARAHQYQQR